MATEGSRRAVVSLSIACVESPEPNRGDEMGTQEPKLHGPKRQHFLPSSYLNGFSELGKLAVYDRESDEVRIQTPKNTAVRNNFYTMEDDQGRKRYEVELMLAEWESKGIEVIRKLKARKQIDPDERSNLSILIALFVGRVPDFVDKIKDMNADLVRKMTEQMFSDTESVKIELERTDGKPRNDREAEEFLEFIHSDRYKIKTNHKWAMGLAVKSTLNLAPILAERNWTVLHRSDSSISFVTTDVPVLLTTNQPIPPSIFGVGFGNSNAVAILPIAHSCALMMTGWGGRLDHRRLPPKEILDLDRAFASRCQRFVIGRDRKLVKYLANQVIERSS